MLRCISQGPISRYACTYNQGNYYLLCLATFVSSNITNNYTLDKQTTSLMIGWTRKMDKKKDWRRKRNTLIIKSLLILTHYISAYLKLIFINCPIKMHKQESNIVTHPILFFWYKTTIKFRILIWPELLTVDSQPLNPTWWNLSPCCPSLCCT